jgi:glycosyltransferase involved in cell wall biosynthesis
MFAQHLQQRTSTPVEVMLQATDPARFHPREPVAEHQHHLTVVAKSRDVLRSGVADAIAAGLSPTIYGNGWAGLVEPALIRAEYVDNDRLPVVYSSAAVVLADHWDTMRVWGFASNRLFDVLACGTPVISDAVPGIEELFGGAVLEYTTPDELRALVEQVHADPAEARRRAATGRSIVLEAHTFDHRAAQLLGLLGVE